MRALQSPNLVTSGSNPAIREINTVNKYCNSSIYLRKQPFSIPQVEKFSIFGLTRMLAGESTPGKRRGGTEELPSHLLAGVAPAGGGCLIMARISVARKVSSSNTADP